VGEDDAPGATNGLVGAGLLGMPVRVDQRVNAAAAGGGPDGREQRFRVGRTAAVDHQRALGTGHRDDVAPGALKQRGAAQIGRGNSCDRLLGRLKAAPTYGKRG
jgi:hypothetical protein